MPGSRALAARLVELRRARDELGPHGFLPARVPAAPASPLYAAACRELPARYHGEGRDVRPWLTETFATWSADDEAGLAALAPAAIDDMMAAVSTLAHAHRWAAMPAPAASHALAAIEKSEDPPFDAPNLDMEAARARLSPAQNAAADELVAAVSKDTFQTVLLDGVTGSGKTEVYFEAVAAALARDPEAQALVLLPEIALTQAVIARFLKRFGVSPVPSAGGDS